MQLIRSITAWYPAFHLGDQPRAIECRIAIVEANGRKYLKTPFAMLDLHADDDPERQLLPGGGYYATEGECLAYLAYEYPWHTQAEPIMEALMRAKHVYGDIVGPNRVADAIGVSVVTNDLYLIARGHKRFGLKTIRQAVKAITPCRVVSPNPL